MNMILLVWSVRHFITAYGVNCEPRLCSILPVVSINVPQTEVILGRRSTEHSYVHKTMLEILKIRTMSLSDLSPSKDQRQETNTSSKSSNPY